MTCAAAQRAGGGLWDVRSMEGLDLMQPPAADCDVVTVSRQRIPIGPELIDVPVMREKYRIAGSEAKMAHVVKRRSVQSNGIVDGVVNH